jgi:hypothetical protein
MRQNSTESMAEFERVPIGLWRATVGALALVALSGLAAAFWLSARPTVVGDPVSMHELEAWAFGPGASGSVSNGRLTLTTTVINRPAYAASDLVLNDFTAQVRAALLSDPDDVGYGLIVRHEGPEDFVILFIGPDGYIAIGQMQDGAWRWRVPWQQWPHIKRGAAENLLRAECRADRCRFFVNDEFAFEINDVPVRGQIGPAVWNPAPDGSVTAVFQEWRAWK